MVDFIFGGEDDFMHNTQILRNFVNWLKRFKKCILCVKFNTKNLKNNKICAKMHTGILEDCKSCICTSCTKYDIIYLNKRKGGLKHMESKYSFDVISKYIIAKCNYDEKTITNLRLQKILYYVQGYFIRKYDIPAFDSDLEAWQYGPVVPDSYYKYCVYGAKPIVFEKEEMYDFLDAVHEIKDKRFIDSIIKQCMSMSITALVNKTHGETPWKLSGSREKIDIDKMTAFFKNTDPLGLGV